MHPHEALIREFYAAFARRDAEGMARCYHEEVFFSDTVFPRLHGAEAGDMWRMLLSRAADLEVTLDSAQADATAGSRAVDGALHVQQDRPQGGHT
jgi:ketosteroid isomerase-like protein